MWQMRKLFWKWILPCFHNSIAGLLSIFFLFCFCIFDLHSQISMKMRMKWMHAKKKRESWYDIHSFKCFYVCDAWMAVCLFFSFFQRSSFVQFRFFFLLHLFFLYHFIIEPFHSIYIDSIDMQTKRDKNKTHRSWFTLNSHFFFVPSSSSSTVYLHR